MRLGRRVDSINPKIQNEYFRKCTTLELFVTCLDRSSAKWIIVGENNIRYHGVGSPHAIKEKESRQTARLCSKIGARQWLSWQSNTIDIQVELFRSTQLGGILLYGATQQTCHSWASADQELSTTMHTLGPRTLWHTMDHWERASWFNESRLAILLHDAQWVVLMI